MSLNKEQVAAFKRAFYEEYGEDLSDEEAETEAVNLLALYRLLTRPLPSERLAYRRERGTLPNDPPGS